MHKSMLQTVYALTFALLLPGTLVASTRSDRTDATREAIQLTQHIERTGRDIQSQADRLEAMRRTSQISNQSHQFSLSRIASHINEDLAPAINRLAEIQPDLPQWHQHAIDQMRSSAATLATHATAAIVNRNPSETRKLAVLDDDYGQLLQNINARATALVQVADAAADYGDAQLKGHRAGLAIAAHD